MDIAALEKHFSGIGNDANLIVLEMSNDMSANACLRSVDYKNIPNISEYILNVDCDEFICCPGKAYFDYSMSDIINNKNRINFKWIISSSSSQKEPITHGFYKGIGKDIARTSAIIEMENVHSFKVSPAQNTFQNDIKNLPSLHLAHHWGRTFKDTIIKTCHQKAKLKNPKNRDFTSYEDFICRQELPARLLYVAHLEETGTDVDISSANYHHLYDLEEENLLIRPYATSIQIKQLFGLYQAYRSRLSLQGNTFIENSIKKASVNNECRSIISLIELRALSQ